MKFRKILPFLQAGQTIKGCPRVIGLSLAFFPVNPVRTTRSIEESEVAIVYDG